jgi:hypothetical protein
MYLLAWQTMVSPKSQNNSKSGLAKTLDERQKDIIISTISTKIKNYLSDILVQILSILGKEDIELYISGLDFTSDSIDREYLLSEAMQVQGIQMLNQSEDFMVDYTSNLAEKLLTGQSTIEQQKIIKEQIKIGYSKIQTQKEAESANQMITKSSLKEIVV